MLAEAGRGVTDADAAGAPVVVAVFGWPEADPAMLAATLPSTCVPATATPDPSATAAAPAASASLAGAGADSVAATPATCMPGLHAALLATAWCDGCGCELDS
mmetsp:Transcript_23664/g.74391  ORF Transcript_23664/g.74391 Transcript_23664/m.74391 type:complete len:103 (-) Transcript_23664:1207-1515(-)